jgi:predicted nucleotidyltransferase component of viral defense system
MAMTADAAASVLARLKNKARSSGISYQQCLQLFFQEEFLRKLSKPKQRNSLILKGGLFIYALTNFESRATVDIDFLLSKKSNSFEETKNMIEEIVNVPASNDFIEMAVANFEEISLQRKYKGISAQIVGRIKNVRVPFNIDIGVGDVVFPKTKPIKIGTQLQDFAAPKIIAYSLESVVAEKFDAILQRYELTGRMKDFYDIYYLSMAFNFDGSKLQTAMLKTLENRGTPYDKSSFKRVVELGDNDAMKTKWKYFLKTIKDETLDFSAVIDGIKIFLGPVYNAIAGGTEWQKTWDCEKHKWTA